MKLCKKKISLDNTKEGETRILRGDSGDSATHLETGESTLENISGYGNNFDDRKSDGHAEEADSSWRIWSNWWGISPIITLWCPYAWYSDPGCLLSQVFRITESVDTWWIGDWLNMKYPNENSGNGSVMKGNTGCRRVFRMAWWWQTWTNGLCGPGWLLLIN